MDLKFWLIVVGLLCLIYWLSNFVDILFKNICEKVFSYIWDSMDFFNKIFEIIVLNFFLVIFDVISLYINIFYDFGL